MKTYNLVLVISVCAALTTVDAKEFRVFQTSFSGRASHILTPEWLTQRQVAILSLGNVNPVIASCFLIRGIRV